MNARLRLSLYPFLFALAFAQSPPPNPIVNPGFEDGKPGDVPAGWRSTTPASPTRLVQESCHSGKQCADLSGAAPGVLLQSFDGVQYRGKKFRYRAAVRSRAGSRAQLWLRVDRSNGKMGFFDNMGDRPVTSEDWKIYEITGEVDRDAQSIFLGLLIPTAGEAWIDDASFEITGDADSVEPGRPLTSRGLQNLQALARVFGYIRYFHPSDEAAAADWTHLAAESTRVVEPAQTPAELSAKLQSAFAQVAPAVRVFPTGTPTPALNLTPGPEIISWRHEGVGLSAQSIYHSVRIIEPAPQGLQLLRRDLPGGVTLLMPMALYRDAAGSPIPVRIPVKPGGSGDDRTTRLAAVIIAWNVMEHFYPYFDVVKTDWGAELPAALGAAAEDRDADAFGITLRKMVAALHDGHGNVNPGAATLNQPILWTWAEGRIVVLATNGVDGISPGDTLVSIDGKPALEAFGEIESLDSGATLQFVRYRALGELLARARGATVRLELEPAGAPGTVNTVTLRYDQPFRQVQEPRPDKVTELEPGIFYLDLNRITDADYAAALPSLVKAKGIVFDMRGYPGGIQNPVEFFGHLIDKPVRTAQFLVPIVTKPDHEAMDFRDGGWPIQPKAPYLTAKRVFITDGRAISYAETCMAIVENYKLAEIVGEPTAGTNGNVNPFTIPGGYTITWTGMKVLKHDGSQHHGVGIQPTIPVSRTRAGIAAGRDEMIERAVEVLKK
jgi:C-terminal processing protease CtpA/Prc